MKTSSCCGAEPVVFIGDASSADYGICPQCGEHCTYEEAYDQDNIETIFSEGSGKYTDTYYFFPNVTEKEVMDVARDYKPIVPQCWEKWYIHRVMDEGDRFISRHMDDYWYAPTDGVIMRFHTESPN